MSYSTCQLCGEMLTGYPGSSCTNPACAAHESDPAKRAKLDRDSRKRHKEQRRAR